MPALPPLVLIADRFTAPARAERVVQAVEAGVRWVHLRDHLADESPFLDSAERLMRRLRGEAREISVSINGRLAVAHRLGLGFHTGNQGPSVRVARQRLGEEALIGYSAHSIEEGLLAVEAGATYLFFSPVFPTPSKPGAPGVGLAGLRAFCAAIPDTPVFALGGIAPARALFCRTTGAHGVAVLSGIMDAPDPSQVVPAYLRALNMPPAARNHLK